MHLFFIKDVRTGLVWLTKIVTDPFHDVKLYYKSPFYLLRGELIDPMATCSGRHAPEASPCSTWRLIACWSAPGRTTTSRPAASPGRRDESVGGLRRSRRRCS